MKPMTKTAFSNTTVMVTGAAGFIGSHLCEALLKEQAQVIGVDNLLTGSQANIEAILATNVPSHNFTFIKADVNQPPESYLPEGTKLDAIMHLASPASPEIYQKYPRETYLVNSWATHQLLDYLLVSHPQAKFLFASTSEVYGDPKVHPQPESYWGNVNPNGVRSCYDEAKRLGETVCGVYHRDFQVDVRIARIFNTYGPRIDLNDGRVVPNFIKHALAQEKLPVYGDGTQTRSYCYVTDLVAGLLLLLTTPKAKGETVNLGNPGEYTVLETARLIKTAVRGEFAEDDLEFLSLPEDDPTRRRPDISRAQELLGWQPEVSFEAGLRETVEFFRG